MRKFYTRRPERDSKRFSPINSGESNNNLAYISHLNYMRNEWKTWERGLSKLFCFLNCPSYLSEFPDFFPNGQFRACAIVATPDFKSFSRNFLIDKVEKSSSSRIIILNNTKIYLIHLNLFPQIYKPLAKKLY